jgi:hypothetical protein
MKCEFDGYSSQVLAQVWFRKRCNIQKIRKNQSGSLLAPHSSILPSAKVIDAHPQTVLGDLKAAFPDEK